jgi:hypothetical protein
MKNGFPLVMALVVSLYAAFSGCSRKPDAKTELDKAQIELAKPQPAAETPPPAGQAPPPQAAPAAVVAVAAAPTSQPAQQMNQAVAAYKAGNLEDAVARLQKLRASPAMSPQQRMALNDAMAAVMTEIYAMAEKGDGRAIAAVKQYEYMQTHR